MSAWFNLLCRVVCRVLVCLPQMWQAVGVPGTWPLKTCSNLRCRCNVASPCVASFCCLPSLLAAPHPAAPRWSHHPRGWAGNSSSVVSSSVGGGGSPPGQSGSQRCCEGCMAALLSRARGEWTVMHDLPRQHSLHSPA